MTKPSEQLQKVKIKRACWLTLYHIGCLEHYIVFVICSSRQASRSHSHHCQAAGVPCLCSCCTAQIDGKGPELMSILCWLGRSDTGCEGHHIPSRLVKAVPLVQAPSRSSRQFHHSKAQLCEESVMPARDGGESHVLLAVPGRWPWEAMKKPGRASCLTPLQPLGCCSSCCHLPPLQ